MNEKERWNPHPHKTSNFSGGYTYYVGEHTSRQPTQSRMNYSTSGHGVHKGAEHSVSPQSDHGYGRSPVGGRDSTMVHPQTAEGVTSNFDEYLLRLHDYPLLTNKTEAELSIDINLRNEYRTQKMCMLMTSDDDDRVMALKIPSILQEKYFGIRLLDDIGRHGSSEFCGLPTYVYKALCTTESNAYVLRRVDGFNLVNFDIVKRSADRWSNLPPHPCITPLRQVFATHEFPDAPPEGGSIVFVYDYFPNVSTLERSRTIDPVPEPLVWVYIIQVALAILHIHSSNLSLGAIHPSKILVNYRYRIRLNCVGLLDVTKHDTSLSTAAAQKMDWMEFGHLIVYLGNALSHDNADLNQRIEVFMKSSYSPELKHLLYLLLSDSESVNTEAIIQLMTPQIANFLQHSWSVADMLEYELKREVENDRLFRIICKINTIVDRGELMNEGNWSETGNRYLVKLFRDYIFHQIDEFSRPVLDMGHIVNCLNKVDLGTMEKVMLMSQEGASIFIVSFAELKKCIENSFTEVVAFATRPLPIPS